MLFLQRQDKARPDSRSKSKIVVMLVVVDNWETIDEKVDHGRFGDLGRRSRAQGYLHAAYVLLSSKIPSQNSIMLFFVTRVGLSETLLFRVGIPPSSLRARVDERLEEHPRTSRPGLGPKISSKLHDQQAFQRV